MHGDYTLRVLTAMAGADRQDLLWWQTGGEVPPITFYINCPFDPDDPSVELLSPENIYDLERAIADTRMVTGGDATYGPLLFVARSRRRRPAATAYPTDARLWPMLDATGPERQIDTAAPATQPHEHATPQGRRTRLER